jgi:hypothetical protein
VHVRVGVRGGVSKDYHPIVAVVCVAKGREHHAARGDPGQDQGGDLAVPQLSVEVSGGKSADASLADNDVAGLGGHVIVDRGRGRLAVGRSTRRDEGRHHAVSGDRVVLGVFEPDPDIRDVSIAVTDDGNGICDPREQSPGLADGTERPHLKVHHQQCRVPGINGRKGVSHWLLPLSLGVVWSWD